MRQSAAIVYETDFYAWTQQQVNLLRSEAFEEVDVPNLIEELEGMARRERRELISRLTVLLGHLLEWQVQSELRSRSWQSTIRSQRLELNLLLDDSPSLRATLDEFVTNAYPYALNATIKETGLILPRFFESCPYTLDEILDDDFLPEN
ncbi:MAG: DUF29 domain-containing protein [Caldilineaceae bacterium]|nr:DUF29 domain-containing protein [Caldilineaceae bacterium]